MGINCLYSLCIVTQEWGSGVFHFHQNHGASNGRYRVECDKYFRVLKHRPQHLTSLYFRCTYLFTYLFLSNALCVLNCKPGRITNRQKYTQHLHGRHFQFQPWKIVVWRAKKVKHMRIPTVKNNQCCRIRMNQLIVKT